MLSSLPLKFCKADNSHYNQLVPLVRQILIDGNSLHAQNYDYQKWRWKYFDLFDAKPCIYLCIEESEIIGYYHCPVYEGVISGRTVSIAMVQDVGMSDKARGKGVFAQLAKFANNNLAKSNIDFVLTYPNDKSIHTFKKYNQYQLLNTLNAYILPIKSAALLKGKMPKIFANFIGASVDTIFNITHQSKQNQTLKVVFGFTDEMIQIFDKHYAQFENHIKRSVHYLEWRFLRKPNHSHVIVTASANNSLHTVLVFGIENLLGTKAAVLLDYATLEPKQMASAFLQLSKNSKNIFNNDIAMFYTSAMPKVNTLLKKCGFLKLPHKLNPRPLNLMAKNITQAQSNLDPIKWQVTLSEWDVL